MKHCEEGVKHCEVEEVGVPFLTSDIESMTILSVAASSDLKRKLSAMQPSMRAVAAASFSSRGICERST